MLLTLTITLTSIALASPNLSLQDPCHALTLPTHTHTTLQIFSVPATLACFTSFPITPTTRKSHIEAVKRFVNFHPYLDLLKDSQHPYFPSHVDLLRELDAIAGDDSVTSEHVFHNDVYALINGLNDAHSNYEPLCFVDKVKVYQPWLVEADLGRGCLVVVDAVVKGKEAGGFDSYWNATLGGRPAAAFVGWDVTDIEGVNALEWIQSYANAYAGKVKAGSSRFNIALPSYQWKNGEMVVVNGSFAVQNRIHNGIKQSIAYTLQNPVNGRKETVDIPWAVTAGSVAETKALFPSASEFYARNCTKKSETHSMSITSGKEIKTMISPVWSQEPVEVHTNNHEKASNGKLSNVYKGRDHSFFLLSDGKTGVWMISHFSPPNETEVMRWASDMTHGLKALEDHGATRLIIDVTNNGGGIICLGCAAAYFIAPWESKTCYRYDIRLTDPLVSLFKRAHEEASRNSSFDASVFNMTMYGRTSEAKAMLSPNELLSPGRTRVRGGVAGRYSNLFTLDHDCIQSLDMVTDATKFPQLKRGWKIKDIGLLSNGICGSTCSNFARTLRDKHHIASFTYGGFKKGRFQPSAFEGGMVVDYAALTQPFSKEVDGAPTLESLEFPLGRARIPFFEVYPDYDKKGEMPAEWVIADSEYYVDGVSSLDYEGLWDAVASTLVKQSKDEEEDIDLIIQE